TTAGTRTFSGSSIASPSGDNFRRLAAFGAFIVLAWLLGRWIIDDAGISYAYARNLATGHGLVAQPGLTPVEGFSNFLWVVTLTPFLVLRIFDPVWTPKILAGALVFATFVLLERAFSKDDVSAPARWLALIALAVSPPIVIWTVSGLENPLTL